MAVHEVLVRIVFVEKVYPALVTTVGGNKIEPKSQLSESTRKLLRLWHAQNTRAAFHHQKFVVDAESTEFTLPKLDRLKKRHFGAIEDVFSV